MTEPPSASVPDILAPVARYYGERLRQFGPTPHGVDWNSADSQALRFSKLLTIVDSASSMSVIDYGCGYGALVDHLHSWSGAASYQGCDISEVMIETARKLHAGKPQCSFTTDASAILPADYVVSSGIFNVKLGHDNRAWYDHVLQTLSRFNGLSTRGFAFNMLSTYSDPEKRRADLFYADPCAMFDVCKRTFSSRVALLHDYPLYEFTILVRK